MRSQHGQPIDKYQLEYVQLGDDQQPVGSVMYAYAEGYSTSLVLAFDTRQISFNFRLRANNSLGYGDFTIDKVVQLCVGCDPTPFPAMAVVVPLVCVLLLLVVGVIVWRYTELHKILAPRLRQVEEKVDPLEDFIVKEVRAQS